MALQTDEELVKASNARIRASLDSKNATAAMTPQLDASANVFALFPDMDVMGMSLQMRGAYSAGLSLSQPLFVGGKIIVGRKMAAIGEDCAELQQRQKRSEVVADVHRAYWTLVAVREKVRLLQTVMQQLDTLSSVTRRSVDAGLATSVDLLRLDSKISEMSYNLRKAESGQRLCEMLLCSRIGLPIEESVTPSDTVISSEVVPSLSTDVSLRPELLLLEKNVLVKEYDVKMQRAELMPTIALAAAFNRYGNIKVNGMTQDATGNYIPFTQKYGGNIGLVALTAQIPLWHGGQQNRNMRKARTLADDARLELDRSRRLLTLQAQQAAQNLADCQDLVKSARTSATLADQTLSQMTLRYDSGLSPLTDLLDARTAWQQSRSNLIEALTNLRIAETDYLLSVGLLPVAE
ncbi:MAG: TolC family protein [Bacteroidales bacterium]|nr:TolC family protein [Bacteroidales bacterium]